MKHMTYDENAPVPHGQENVPKKKKLVILDTSDALEREAFTAAEARMTENKENLRGFKGIFKKIWKHNLFHEYYRQKEVFIARKKIEDSGNVYVNENLGKEAHDSAMESVMERFASEFEEEMIHGGEEKKTISSDSQEEGELKKRIQELIQNYAKGNLSDEQFVLEKNAVFNQELQGIKGESGEAVARKGKMYADNLLEIAKQLHQSIEHGAKLEDLDTEFDIIVGRARSGERTEAQFNRVDRWIEKVQKIKFIGSIANEATVAAAVSAVYALGTKVALGGARAASKILGPLGFGISAGIGGAVAGARENKRLKEERAQHARERARGKTFEKGAERRAEMEQFQYETKSAPELAHDLETSLERFKANPQKASLDLLFTKLNEVECRIAFSDCYKVDLIHYSDVKSIEKERLRMDFLRAEVKVYLRKLLAEKKVGKVDIDLPFENEAGLKDYLFLAREVELEDKFSKEKEKKDKSFNRMKRVKVASATAKGIAIGLGVGIAAQEIATTWNDAEGIFTPSSAHAADISSSLSELTPVPRYTSLEYVRRMLMGELHQNYDGPYVETIIGQNHFNLPSGFVLQNGPAGLTLMRGQDIMLSGLKLKPDGTLTDESLRLLQGQGITADAVSISIPGKGIFDQKIIGNSNYNLPQGFSFVKNSAGTYDLIGPKVPGGNISIENLKLNPDGSLSQEAKDALTQRGVRWGNVTEHISDAKQQEYIFDPEEYVAKHPDKFHRINRLWYDNDTPKPKFDYNELKLHWGGVHGTGIDKSGKFVMDISHMTKNGSFHNGLSIDAQKLMSEGKMKMLFSLTRGTQNNVIEVPIDAQGHISIDPNSENGKMLFEMDAKGHAVFKGKFAEVAQSLGVKNGVEQMGILATHTGDGLGSIRDVIDIPAVDKTSTFFQVAEHSTKFMIPSDYEVDWPFIIPMAGRRPLERPTEEAPIPYSYYYFHELNDEQRKELISEMSPRIKDDPKAKLDSKKEIDWYFSSCRNRMHTAEYLKRLEELDIQVKNKGGKNVEATVALAVAGHQEHKNIYRSLMTYAVQKNKENKSVWRGDRSKYEIVMYVNWPSGSSPERTLAEIERFKRDYPDVPVHVFKEEINTGKVELGLYKKKAFDLALLRHKKRGATGDLMIIANDADMVYAAENYLEEVNRTMRDSRNQNIDALLGRQDLDPEVYAKNPTFHAAHRFLQFLDATLRAKFGSSYTQGRNTVLRGSAYAAVGGNRTEAFYADIEFGNLFKAARNYRNENNYGNNRDVENPIGYSNSAWVMVDPRREIDKFKSGEKIAYTWGGDFDSRAVRGEKNRKNELPEDIDLDALAIGREDGEFVDDTVLKFRRVLEDEIQALLDVYMPQLSEKREVKHKAITLHSSGITFEDAKKIIDKSAWFLGIKLDVEKRSDQLGNERINIKIVDTSKLRNWLNRYAKENRKLAKIKKHALHDVT